MMVVTGSGGGGINIILNSSTYFIKNLHNMARTKEYIFILDTYLLPSRSFLDLVANSSS